MKTKVIKVQDIGNVELIAPQSTYEQPVIVEKSVVSRLVQLLQNASFHQIKADFTDELMEANNIEQYVQMLQDELNFHRTVNCIRELSEEESAQMMADGGPAEVIGNDAL